MSAETVIETHNLTRRYAQQTAVDDLSFTVREGEIYGFLGPNGAGKTTTLLMLMGLTRSTSGTVQVCGIDPQRKPAQVKKRVGYLPENVGFYGDLNASQSLAYVADLNNIPKEEAAPKIQDLLALVGLEKDARKKVSAFSRGMKQRLGIAEVLIKDPKVMFLDEPTIGLDPDGALRLIDLIQRLNREHNISVLLSSHNLYQVQKICHRVGIMITGKMVAQGSIESLAKEKFGLGEKEYSLEEIYMKYFQEA